MLWLIGILLPSGPKASGSPVGRGCNISANVLIVWQSEFVQRKLSEVHVIR